MAKRKRPAHHSIEPGLQGTALQVREDKQLLRQGYWFDTEEADRVCDFFAQHLKHSKGEWRGQPFVLQDWQRCIIRRLFGWRQADGTRRYRDLYLEIPRKNGKSTLAAAIALYIAFADGEPAAEIYCVANDVEQAMFVFEEAKRMADASPTLSQICETYSRSILKPDDLSTIKILSSQPKHGTNPSGAVMDEVHQFKKRTVWDAVTTGYGSRRQPLTIVITTAGEDMNGFGYAQHEYAQKVIDGIIPAPHFLAVIFAAREEDDWTDRETWRRANPGLGVNVKETFLRDQCEKARHDTGERIAFQIYNLNIWTHGVKKWLEIADWNACAGAKVTLEELRGRKVYGGLDLSKTTDLTALVLIAAREGGGYDVLCRFWVPEEAADKRARKDRVPYPTWVKQGLITATPGNVVDYDFIERDIAALAKDLDIQEIAYDRAFATQLVQRLQDLHSVTMTEFGQGFLSMAAPTAELERLVVSHQLRHGGHAVLKWNASNVVVRTDPAGNMKPDKSKSTERIDGVVALVMALGRATLAEDTTSVYESRGLHTL